MFSNVETTRNKNNIRKKKSNVAWTWFNLSILIKPPENLHVLADQVPMKVFCL